MPQFTVLDDQQREAIITFVLGLVAEPPASQYVYKADPRRSAIIEGTEIIEKYNCTGCHTLEMDRWELAFAPDAFSDPAPRCRTTRSSSRTSRPSRSKASEATDAAGLLHASVTGMPATNEQGLPVRVDEDGAPLEADDTETPASYLFVPWENMLINGQVWQAGMQNLIIPESAIDKQYEPVGGFLPRLAFPAVIAEAEGGEPERQARRGLGLAAAAVARRRAARCRPSGCTTSCSIRTAIRPAAVLRMPKFNMSADEATKLVNYFAAVDRVDYPYDFDPRTRQAHLEEQESQHPERLADALKIVTDNNFCIKCHLLGDFVPEGRDSAKAPQLGDVYRRLRPEYALDWIANPKRHLALHGDAGEHSL